MHACHLGFALDLDTLCLSVSFTTIVLDVPQMQQSIKEVQAMAQQAISKVLSTPGLPHNLQDFEADLAAITDKAGVLLQVRHGLVINPWLVLSRVVSVFLHTLLSWSRQYQVYSSSSQVYWQLCQWQAAVHGVHSLLPTVHSSLPSVH